MMLFSCNSSNTAQSNIDSTKGLKEYYSAYFPVGVSVAVNDLRSAEAALIVKHFNSITAENAMKMRPIHPAEDVYNWKNADSIAAFAKKHGMKLRGHALIWHQEVPDWMYYDKAGRQVSKETLLQRMKEHITAVVNRYKNSVYAWDVVNEAISDDPGEMYRHSKLFEICGEDYIAKAFEYAHEADPSALLFYNDYNEVDTAKRRKIISLIAKLKSQGVPVSGVGLQSHWTTTEPTKQQLEQTLEDFATLHLPLQITELDISVYSRDMKKQKDPENIDTSFTLQKEKAQVDQYRMCFDVFRKYRDVITGVTFWDVSDRHSWLDNFPVKGRKDYPLLFGRDLKPKKAFWQVALFDVQH
jgi:endo-1,4-beta-xylanase